MSKEKLGKEPAFAVDQVYHIGGKYVGSRGISKRFYAACAAMQGFLSGNLVSISTPDITIIEMSYKLADELLKQENE